MCEPYKALVTMRVVQAAGYDEPRDAISHDWLAFLDEADLLPILVPNQLRDVRAFAQMHQASMLILTNGDDIHPALYGGAGKPGVSYAKERDETELKLYAWAREIGLPILAICRGFQLVNIAQGGSLVYVKEARNSHVNVTHAVQICDSLFLDDMRTDLAQVNSFHNLGVIPSGLGRGLTPFAIAPDGLVEGFYCTQYPLLALQWHPERPGPMDYLQKNLALRFLREGSWW